MNIDTLKLSTLIVVSAIAWPKVGRNDLPSLIELNASFAMTADPQEVEAMILATITEEHGFTPTSFSWSCILNQPGRATMLYGAFSATEGQVAAI